MEEEKAARKAALDEQRRKDEELRMKLEEEQVTLQFLAHLMKSIFILTRESQISPEMMLFL